MSASLIQAIRLSSFASNLSYVVTQPPAQRTLHNQPIVHADIEVIPIILVRLRDRVIVKPTLSKAFHQRVEICGRKSAPFVHSKLRV